MAATQTIINRALRLLGMLDPNESPEAVDTQTALEALNAMMARWEADGVSVGWTPVAAASDDLPAPVEAEEAIAYNLAVRLRPEYGVQLAPDVIATAQNGLSRLLADIGANTYARLAYDLPVGEFAWVNSQRAFERGF
jgi:hypothetical protein